MSADKAPDFGAKLAELEAITTWFESDEMDLNAALAKFERGMELAAELKQELQQVENRVETIKAKFETGPAGTAPLEDDEPPTGDNPSLF